MIATASLNPKALLRRSFYILPALLSCLPAISAETEQKDAAASEEVIQLSPFTVSTEAGDRYRASDAISAVRVRAPLIDTGSSISVLTREMMNDVSGGRLWDAAKFVAGVQEGRLSTFNDRMIMRGFENNGRTVDNFFNDSGQNYDESLVDRLEVSKGPNAILSPAGTPGGTVNVVTKSPQFTAHNTLTAMVGSYNAGKATLDLTGPVNGVPELAYRLISTAQDGRAEWSSDSRMKRKTLSPQLTYRFSPVTQLTAKVMYSDTFAVNPPYYILDSNVYGLDKTPVLDPSLQAGKANGHPNWSGIHYIDWNANVLFTTGFNEHINLRVAANARRESETSKQAALVLPGTSNRYDPTGTLTPNYIWSRDPVSGVYTSTFSRLFDYSAVSIDRTSADAQFTFGAVQADLSANYKFGPVTSQTVAGGGASNEHTYDRRWRPAVTVYNLAAGQQISMPDFTNQYQDNRSSNKNSQVYINQRLGFLDERVFLNVGVLKYSVTSTARNAFTNATASVLDSSRNMTLQSIVVKPLKNVSVYASNSTNGSPLIANNQALWQEGKQIEFGVKSEFFKQRLSLTVAHFQISQTNVAVPNPVYHSGADITAPQSILSDYKDHGIEFEANGALTKELSVIATYTQLKLRDSLGRRVRAIADETGSFLVNYHFKNGVLDGLSASLSAAYSGKKAGDIPAASATVLPAGVITQSSFYVPAYTTWNCNVSYHWRRATFTLFVDNLTDVDGITQAGGRGGLGLAPAFRRNVRFSTSFEF